MSYSNMFEDHCQGAEPEYLVDPQFDWKVRKMETIRLAKIYTAAGYSEYGKRAAGCSTYLQFAVHGNDRSLQWANFCQLRLCPLCTARRARSAAHRLSLVMDAVQRKTGCQYIFLTLTMRNVDGPELGQALSQLTTAWHKLVRHRRVAAAVKGWFRALEVTRGEGRRDKGYHPHIHAVLAVEDDYFRRDKGLYLSHKDWCERWQKALGVDYLPSVRISRTNNRKSGRGAVLEAAKYVVKSVEYISPKVSDERAIEIVTDYTKALYHRRLTGLGGWLKEAAALLDVGDLDQADLVHADDNYIRADLVEMVEHYYWTFGAGDYILADRHSVPVMVKED